ncbi:MAG: anti-sigma factor [Pseudomonadota bacterium]|nr:anti-sigma factor [Pseudomonadota bacterium]
MTDAANPTTGPDPDVAAAELALGLLEGEDRALALRRMLSDPAFARDVERWRLEFAALFARMPEVSPPPETSERVIARLDAPATARPGYWRPLAIASSLAAASLLGLLVVRPDPVAPPPVVASAPAPMVAAFMVEGIKTPLVATYDSESGRLSMPGPMPIPAGKSAQLWAIIGTGAPQPLGLFHEAGDRVEAEARSATPLKPGTTFAISLEPIGGSPTGLPTGPVVASATLIRA